MILGECSRIPIHVSQPTQEYSYHNYADYITILIGNDIFVFVPVMSINIAGATQKSRRILWDWRMPTLNIFVSQIFIQNVLNNISVPPCE